MERGREDHCWVDGGHAARNGVVREDVRRPRFLVHVGSEIGLVFILGMSSRVSRWMYAGGEWSKTESPEVMARWQELLIDRVGESEEELDF